jgi:DNA-binding NarL/FixJ family response regulator
MPSIKKKIKIAVVDDHQLFRKGIITLLGEFKELEIIIEAANGQELVTALEKEQPDVILLDLEMPIMDGIDTTIYVRKKYPDIKIIILTMHDDESFTTHLIKKGANAFLLKDSDIEIVVDAIYVVMDTGYYLDDRFSNAMIKNLVKSQNIKPSFNKINLTEKEKEIITMICKEYTNKEISEKRLISLRTVESHRNFIMQKIGARNTAGIVMYAVKNNLVDQPIDRLRKPM